MGIQVPTLSKFSLSKTQLVIVSVWVLVIQSINILKHGKRGIVYARNGVAGLFNI